MLASLWKTRADSVNKNHCHIKTINNVVSRADLRPKWRLKKENPFVQISENSVVKKLTFSVRFEVAVDGWRCDITETAGPVTQGCAAPLTGR